MILKAFKEKSIQKFINRLLKTKKPAVSAKKLESVGVIIDSREFSDVDGMKQFVQDLGIQLPRIQIVVFVDDDKKTERLWGNYFSSKDLGYNGKIKHPELQTFLNCEFDALINFYKTDDLELKLASGLSKANFKIGLSNVDDRLFDFILDLSISDFDIFKSELTKYLTILKKI